MVLEGTIKNGTIVLDQPPALPDGQRVEVKIKPVAKPASPLGETAGGSRGYSAEEVIKLLNMPQPAPDDAQCDRILDEERMKKYGS